MIRPPPISTRTDTLFPYTTLFRSAPRIDIALGNRVLRRSNQLLMHLPHRISAIGAIVGYLHAGHQHRITACSRNILVEKGDIAQIVTLEFLPVALVGIELEDRKSTRLNSSH